MHTFSYFKIAYNEKLTDYPYLFAELHNSFSTAILVLFQHRGKPFNYHNSKYAYGSEWASYFIR